MRLEQGIVVGSYQIERMLGRGGMAEVYLASHVELGRQVALKVIAGDLGSDPDFMARFQREGRMQASLEHPHAVTVYEAGESDHGLYIAMRYVPGSSLAELMNERALTSANALSLLGQVAGALDAAHTVGLVHRDVKPQNVLVGDAEDAYLGDFGLTTVGGTGGVTATGKLVGTVSYLAPEVIRGTEATAASDRYAFAATVFEALSGSVVFPRPTEAAILYAHTNEPPPRISRRRPELPERLDGVFTRGLAKDPGERFASAAQLLDAVETELDGADLGPPPPPGAWALDETTVEPTPPVATAAPQRRSARGLVAWGAAAALLGAAIAVGVVALADDNEGSEVAAVAPLEGTRPVGSDLSDPGRALDCRGRRPGPDSSDSCTIVQSGLPGKTLVVPEDGVIKRWSLRSARGEFSLAVLRPRGRGAGQVARSRNEFVSNGGLHSFHTNLAVEQGDVLGVVLVPGSGIGVRSGVEGATTSRWIPRLIGEDRPPDHPAGSGFDHELLLRADLLPGGRRPLPDQVTGAAAARLPTGDVTARRKLRFSNGRPVEIRLVRIGDRFVLDQFLRGRRTARVDVPDFKPSEEGRLIQLEVYAEAAPQHLGVYLEYANEESQRILDHYYDSYPSEFDFID